MQIDATQFIATDQPVNPFDSFSLFLLKQFLGPWAICSLVKINTLIYSADVVYFILLFLLPFSR